MLCLSKNLSSYLFIIKKMFEWQKNKKQTNKKQLLYIQHETYNSEMTFLI